LEPKLSIFAPHADNRDALYRVIGELAKAEPISRDKIRLTLSERCHLLFYRMHTQVKEVSTPFYLMCFGSGSEEALQQATESIHGAEICAMGKILGARWHELRGAFALESIRDMGIAISPASLKFLANDPAEPDRDKLLLTVPDLIGGDNDIALFHALGIAELEKMYPNARIDQIVIHRGFDGVPRSWIIHMRPVTPIQRILAALGRGPAGK